MFKLNYKYIHKNLNANVSMPILSIRLWDKDGHRNIFDAEGGEYIHLATGESDPIVARHGVYFINMKVPKGLLGNKDVGRRGMP